MPVKILCSYILWIFSSYIIYYSLRIFVKFILFINIVGKCIEGINTEINKKAAKVINFRQKSIVSLLKIVSWKIYKYH